ncbi:hypothetical protein ACWD6K_31360 [Streptomyces sp. NPDC002431]
MSDRDHLLHLVDRARRRNILPAELDQLADGIEELHASRAVRMAAQYADRAVENGKRAEHAEAALARVRALHRDAYAGSAEAGTSCTAGCGAWPCPTLTTLDGPHTA